ncbi:MAG: murein transglycosylase domain-containing protein [Methylobacter sp.]
MQRRHLLKLLGLAPVGGLIACTPDNVRYSFDTARQLMNTNIPGSIAQRIPSTGIVELDSLVQRQFLQLADRLIREWGDKKVASPREYVKYTDQYQSRALVNFETGVIRVETIARQQPKQMLEQAIFITLLTPEDPAGVDVLSDKNIQIGPEPFLHNLVLDHQNQPIRYQWRARQYAQYLVRTAYRQDRYHNKTRHFVTFNMARTYQASQQRRYEAEVQLNSRRFNIPVPLIYAIIEAESSFNPYAISTAPAYGLMQIVPRTAGRDAHELIYNRPGTPTKDYLFVPQNNIRMGTAYLSILDRRYLAAVNHASARQYAVIAGYNTGSGNVLKAFDSNRERAVARINRMTPNQVYNHLIANLPYQETRRYLQKVIQFERKYA